MSNLIDHPDHYRRSSGHEAAEVIEAWGLPYHLGTVVAYICRCDLKGSAIVDLEKAAWHLQREIERRKAMPTTYAAGEMVRQKVFTM